MLIYSDAMQWWHGSAELLLLMRVLMVMKIYADIDKGDNADYAHDADEVLSGEDIKVQVGRHGFTWVSRNADLPKPHTREEEKRRAPGFCFTRHTIHWIEGETERGK